MISATSRPSITLDLFDLTYPIIDESALLQYKWKKFYGNVTEAMPPDIPKPLGRDVDLCMMCNSDHAGDKCSRRSRTGILIFYKNMALIDWISKKQSTFDLCL
jgi:hypothetical protein